MATTPLAAKADVENRLRRPLTTDEAGPGDKWINAILEEASLLVTTYCGQGFDEPVPDEVRVVTSRVAARGVTAVPASTVGQESVVATMGPFAVNRGFSADSTSGGVWLSKADKQMLAPWTSAGQVFSVDLA